MPNIQSSRTLAIAIAALSVLALALNLSGALPGVAFYVPLGGLALSAAILATPGIGAFLNFFVVFYGIGYIGLMLVLMLGGLLQIGWVGLIPPLTAFTSAAFGLLAILLARLPMTRGVFRIADPYFETADKGALTLWPKGSVTMPERWIAYLLLGVIILINLAQVGITVRLNEWSRQFYDTIQNKNEPEFWRLLYMVWVPLVAVLITSNIIEFLLSSSFKMRWRDWMTIRYMSNWLENGSHYRLQFVDQKIDNPDQRIQEDITKFIGLYGAGGLTSSGSAASTYALTIAMIQQISSFVSFSVVLWGLSSNLALPGLDFKTPGLLFWIAIIYAGIGTWVAHRIGRRLIRIFFVRETREADFRFGLSRLREFSEPISLLRGERTEVKGLTARFQRIIGNFFEAVHVKKWLDAFTSLYGSANSVIPIVISAPFFFSGQITLGILMQIASAFARVDAALAFFIDRYATVAEYKAVADRLNGFEQSLTASQLLRKKSGIVQTRASDTNLHIPALSLILPNGQPMLSASNLTIRAGERTLLTGPSGSGKSTLFRAIAGIWPFGEGRIEKPSEGEIMLLPQRPYIPIGSLRHAVPYPAGEGAFSDADIRAALGLVHLPHLAGRLDEETNWSQILSGGEQQRLAVARAILAKPGWLFLDEATSALDEGLEASIYGAIRDALPGTTLVSIGHRSSLIAIHDRRIDLQKNGDGLFTPRELSPV